MFYFLFYRFNVVQKSAKWVIIVLLYMYSMVKIQEKKIESFEGKWH